MSNATEAPKSPNLKTLAKWVETLDEIINEGNDLAITTGTDTIEHVFDEPRVVALRDALEWTYTFLENRRDYHKKRQVKAKTELALMEERLQAAGVDIRSIKKEAERLSDDAILGEE